VLQPAIASPIAPGQTLEQAHVAESANDFGFKLYRRASEQLAGESLVLSASSVHEALSLTGMGGAGQTLEAMARTLGLSPEDLLQGVAALSQSLPGVDSPLTLRVANKLWNAPDFEILERYLDRAEERFNASAEPVDFAQNERAAEIINQWVEQQTEGLIEELISPDVLDESTALVLTNAVYFLSNWATAFDADLTRPDAFTRSDGQRIWVDMMSSGKQSLPYTELEDGTQAVELPYADDRYAMLMLVPEDPAGLAELEASLTQRWLSEQVVDRFTRQEAIIRMPRFTTETSLNLGETLESMGMAEAFGNGADFSNLSHQVPLEISDVVHQAWIDVDEEGTEAAAATGIVVGVTMVGHQPPPRVVEADKPFLYLIRDRQTGGVLFMGRQMSPEETQAPNEAQEGPPPVNPPGNLLRSADPMLRQRMLSGSPSLRVAPPGPPSSPSRLMDRLDLGSFELVDVSREDPMDEPLVIANPLAD
jgi:serpin B